MNELQKLFEKTIEEQFNHTTLHALFIAKKIKETGFNISNEQVEGIKQQLQNATDDEIQIDIPGLNGKKVDLGDEKELRDFVNRIQKSIPKLYKTTLINSTQTLLRQLKKNAPKMLTEHKAIKAEFEKDINRVWGKALHQLEVLLVTANEAGDHINEELRAKAVTEQDFVFEVIARLHARACQVAYEILTLLKAGYADGAHARWRSLYEMVVVAYFIIDKGQEVAERFLNHNAIEVAKGAGFYEKYHERLGYDPFPSEELALIEQNKQEAKTKYDENFLKEYGWASAALNNPNPKFYHLEVAVKLDHMRPYYKWASQNVHVGTIRMYNSLGLTNISDNRLHTGPSIRGLAIPIDSTSITLTQITTVFLGLEETLDNSCLGNALLTMSEVISKACVKAAKVSEAGIDNGSKQSVGD